MTRNLKARWFLLTLNNPTDSPQETPEGLWTAAQGLKAKFLTGQLERGASGTPHYQFVLWVPENVRCSVIKNVFPRAHIEIVKGTPEQAIEYCTKEDTRISSPFLFGQQPVKRNSKTDWDRVFDDAKAGRFDLIPAKIKVSHYANLQRIAKDHIKGIDCPDVRGLWITGRPGLGKTHWARMDFAKGNYYAKMANKWFDGYQGESVCILDDFDKKGEVLGHHIKIWADKWSFTAEAKGTAIAPQYKCFVITSNYLPEEIFSEQADEVLLLAIARRFKVYELSKRPETGERYFFNPSVEDVTYEPLELAEQLREHFGLN